MEEWTHNLRCAANCMLDDETHESSELFPLHYTDQYDRDHCGHYLCRKCLRSMGTREDGWRVKCPLCSRFTKARAFDRNIQRLLHETRRERLVCGADLVGKEVLEHQMNCVLCLRELLKDSLLKIKEVNEAYGRYITLTEEMSE